MKRIILFATALLFALTSFAQPKDKGRHDWREKMKAEKIAYFTEAMDLTTEEAESFWPVYNQVFKEIKHSHGKVFEKFKALDEALESGKGDIEKLLKEYLAAQADAHKLEDAAYERFVKVLSVEKIAKLYIAEENFRRQQFQKLNPGGPAKGRQ